MLQFLRCLTSGDLELWLLELKIYTPITPALVEKVHTDCRFSNFYASLICFQVMSPICGTDGRSRRKWSNWSWTIEMVHLRISWRRGHSVSNARTQSLILIVWLVRCCFLLLGRTSRRERISRLSDNLCAFLNGAIHEQVLYNYCATVVQPLYVSCTCCHLLGRPRFTTPQHTFSPHTNIMA